MRKFVGWGLIAIVTSVSLYYYSIQNTPTYLSEGEILSKKYCSSCHEYAAPQLLPEHIWVEKVLPEMGLRLGIGDKNTLLSRMSLKLFDQLNNIGIYPNKNLLSESEWLSIVHYYRSNAMKDSLSNSYNDSSTDGGRLFEQMQIHSDHGAEPSTTLVRFIPKRKEIWLGNRSKEIKKYSLEGIQKRIIHTPSPVVDAIDQTNPIYLGIGNMLPNEDRNGRMFHVNDKGTFGMLLLDSLHRPVQMVRSDIDKDGVDDLIILEFGYETGQVRLVNGKTGTTSIISHQPGARNIHLRDIDKDGLMDIYILFAQAREQVKLFHNLGNNTFQEEVLLRFPSVYGSSYLEMADMNNDGLEDLVLSFGDNADYSITKKSFHGIAIYINNGKGQYKKEWFYPTYGATKTIAKDFDNDGDLDLATIAFFSEAERGGSFIYFENKGGMNFLRKDHRIPQAKWLVMESDDMDNDGDQDIILGNFQMGSNTTSTDFSKKTQALVLRNNTK